MFIHRRARQPIKSGPSGEAMFRPGGALPPRRDPYDGVLLVAGSESRPLWLYADATQRLRWHPATACWLAAMDLTMFELCLHRHAAWAPGCAVFLHDETDGNGATPPAPSGLYGHSFELLRQREHHREGKDRVHWDVSDLVRLGPIGDWRRCIEGLQDLHDRQPKGGGTCSRR